MGEEKRVVEGVSGAEGNWGRGLRRDGRVRKSEKCEGL